MVMPKYPSLAADTLSSGIQFFPLYDFERVSFFNVSWFFVSKMAAASSAVLGFITDGHLQRHPGSAKQHLIF